MYGSMLVCVMPMFCPLTRRYNAIAFRHTERESAPFISRIEYIEHSLILSFHISFSLFILPIILSLSLSLSPFPRTHFTAEIKCHLHPFHQTTTTTYFVTLYNPLNVCSSMHSCLTCSILCLFFSLSHLVCCCCCCCSFHSLICFVCGWELAGYISCCDTLSLLNSLLWTCILSVAIVFALCSYLYSISHALVVTCTSDKPVDSMCVRVDAV